MYILTYIYPGWHKEPARKNRDGEILNEWDLVLNARSVLREQRQPKIPLFIYDDSDVKAAEYQIDLAMEYGIDCFIYCLYWSRGKRVLYKPLEAFLQSKLNTKIKFAVMWANRMPRGILPVKGVRGPLIHKGRFVYTDRDDFLRLVEFVAKNYFSRDNYFKVGNKYLFPIFDSTFFLRDLGTENTRLIIDEARRFLVSNGYCDIFLMALNPAPAFFSEYKKVGFDAVSHYVWLPDWKGDDIQRYGELVLRRQSEWKSFSENTGLSYFPSVSPGWDATPRGFLHSDKIKRRYPFYPVVVGESPEGFRKFLSLARKFTLKENRNNPLLFITSMNEWSEGHYLEPDRDFGYGFLEAVKYVRDEL